MFDKTGSDQDPEQTEPNVMLYICKKIVELNGGTLKAHSAGENLGATFEFDMKMKVPDDQHPQSCSQESQSDESEDDGEDPVDISYSDTRRSDYMSVFKHVNKSSGLDDSQTPDVEAKQWH